MRWPGLPAQYKDVVERLFDVVDSERRERKPTVADEQTLAQTVRTHLEEMAANPAKYRIDQVTAGKLRGDPNFMSEALEAGVVRCSRLWPLSQLVYLPDVEAVQCHGYDDWIVVGPGVKAELTAGNPFSSDKEVESLLRNVITNLQGVTGSRQISEALPVAQSQIGTVMRLTVAIEPAVSDGTGIIATIRIPRAGNVNSLAQYVPGVMPQGCADFLEACVRGRVNMAITGGTGTGKTTLLRVLSTFIDEDQVVVTIEEAAELQLNALHEVTRDGKRMMVPWVRLSRALATVAGSTGEATNVTYGFLIRSALRQDPDRIIVGEARSSEVVEACKGLVTGHDGSWLSLHADDAEDAIARMVDMALEHPNYTSEKAAEKLIRRAVEVIVHLKKDERGNRRLSGIYLVHKGGGGRWIYQEDDDGIIVRETSRIGDLERIRRKLKDQFPNGEVPMV